MSIRINLPYILAKLVILEIFLTKFYSIFKEPAFCTLASFSIILEQLFRVNFLEGLI